MNISALFGEDDQKRISSEMKTLYSCEMSRITLRLSSIMAWIMVQRAVFSGKMQTAAVERYGLEFQDVCLVDNRVLHGVLPSYVCSCSTARWNFMSASIGLIAACARCIDCFR